LISDRRKVYSDDLLNVTRTFQEKLEEIEKKLGNDFVINQGLFLMITAYFEDSVRTLMKVVLVNFPLISLPICRWFKIQYLFLILKAKL